MFTKKSRCQQTRLCAIPRLKTAAGCIPHFASAGRITRLSPDPDKGMAGRTVQGLIDVLEGNYGGDVTKMPYVVNKEAFEVGARPRAEIGRKYGSTRSGTYAQEGRTSGSSALLGNGVFFALGAEDAIN